LHHVIYNCAGMGDPVDHSVFKFGTKVGFERLTLREPRLLVMSLNQPVQLDDSTSEQILSSVPWRNGITPFGKPAPYPCFVLSAMPEIITIQQQPHRTFIVTQSDWTANLVSSCVVWSTFEYTTLQALSDCQLLFENYSSINTERKILHLLQLDARAWFSTANILRPTMKLRQQLESALSLWPKDEKRAWMALQRVWSDFGYFWPRKIQLGHRFHVPWPFEVPHDLPDKLYPLRLAKDEASTRIEYKINSGKLGVLCLCIWHFH
jgi:hypothetical protein